MNTKASSKVSYNANRGVLLKLQEKGGSWFLPTPQGGKARGKWWGVNFRQTLCALFVFFPTPWKTRVCHPFWPDNNICKQLLAYEKKKEGKKEHNAITALPIKTELNKSSSSNHSHMNTCVAVIPNQRHFVLLAEISSQITAAFVW